jgi:hypothetical protein
LAGVRTKKSGDPQEFISLDAKYCGSRAAFGAVKSVTVPLVDKRRVIIQTLGTMTWEMPLIHGEPPKG